MSRVLFIGRSVLDMTALVEDFPGPDDKIKALENSMAPGGSALNAAVVFSHLGGHATLATSLGTEHFTRDCLLEDLDRFGVQVEDVCDDPAYRIPISIVVSTRSLGMRMIVNDAGDDCSRLKARTDLFGGNFHLIQLDQYERHFVAEHADAIRAFEGDVILDGGGWKSWSPDFLRLSDIPVVSEVFCPDGPAGFAALCDEFGISRWAMTCGESGIVWRDGDSQGELPAVHVRVVDTLGAGDIFHGAFCHEFARTGDFVPALESANVVAARSCESIGTRSWMNA